MSKAKDYTDLTYTDLYVWAQADGAFSALNNDGGYGHPGEQVGALVAAAYSKSGPHEAAEVLQEHLRGWNMAAAKLGWTPISQARVRDECGRAIGDRLTAEEKQEIRALL